MRYSACVGLATLLLVGCGEFAYKRGANAKGLEATKKSCQSAGNEATIEKCLEDNGWMVQKLDALGLPDSELFATASVSEDNRNPMQTLPDKTTANQTDTVPTGASEVIEDKVKLATTKPTQDESLKKSEASVKGASANSNVTADSPKKVAPAINPFEKYKINSWWKMGGGSDVLETSMANCTRKLGDAHQPDRKNQIFTRAFAACMYESGWRGLREKQ